MNPGDEIEVRKCKWPDRVIDSGTEVFLGEDEHGRWHALPAGRPLLDQDGEAIWRLSVDAVSCYPRHDWWIPVFTPPGSFLITRERREVIEYRHEVSPRTLYIHIAQPLEPDGDAWRFMDLELDVVVRPEGSVEVIDEEDLVSAIERFGLPLEIAERARREAASVAEACRAGAEPFATVGPAWLEAFTRSDD